MRAKDFITELFRPGQDINFKWSRPFKDEVNVLGKTPQGHELSINFWEITDDIVAIDFTIDADVEQDPDPDTSPKSGHELTRHGEEFAVFTQVVNAITQYLNKLPKNNVFFQVKRTEAQREPLYLKIANRVAKQLGFRQGTEQELEATNPGLYNKFDNRYSKLLWYTNTPQGVAEGLEQDYLSQVPNLTWKPVSRSVWNTIQDEGLDEEQDAPKHTDWIMASLIISPDDARALQAFDSDAIEDFNRFDIHLKSRHPGLTDLIDYDNGTVTIVKPSQMQGVAEGSPNFNREWDEATRYPEFVNLGKEKWIELVSKGKPVTVTRKNVNKINNTDAADPKSFKLLDPEKQKRALAQLDNGDVEMPIVARYSDGYLELIGGNTRLTAQMAKDGQAKVWLFNVPEELTQGVAEGESNNTPNIGINVRSDGDIDYASLIVDGQKKYESRKTDSLGPYVGKTVGIVRTGTGPAVAIGQVTIGEPIVVNAEKFNKLRKQHLVPQGSKFDIDVDSTKYLYPMIDPVRWSNERLIKHRGIVSRKIQEQGVAEDAVEDLEKDLKEPHSYDAIDHMMKTIAREEGITAKELHDRFVGKHDMTPDDWVKNKLAENFKDGKNPGRKGLSKRMGVNTKASVSALRKVAKNSSGEKQRMAHWLANMKSGRKKS
jgi:hypothetical protein